MRLSSLFSPSCISKLSLGNRLVVAPMTRVTASEDGVASERMKAYYEDFARGRFALIITEGIYIDTAWSQTYAFQAGMVNTRQALAWHSITDAVHHQGGRIFAQIQHSGALSQGNHYAEGTVAPSAVRPVGKQMTFYRGEGEYPVPRELDEDQIQDIITGFADAASRAVNEAGFDGVEIHGANGYLLDQFFTDYTNQRTDRWGGDIASRLALSLEVISAVRTRLGKDVPVGIRISQGKVNDFFHKWANGEEDARVVFTLLANSGIDYLHLTEFEAWQPAFDGNPLSLVALARKYAPELTIIANGSLHDVARAEEVLAAGAEFIALGRGALANHNWPQQVKNGQPVQTFDGAILGPIADIKDCEIPALCLR
ncbi:NADH:flavin oxidoreductase [Erwiniaceae bacterium BAC15a-03b]|uniref:NADH:flavin oxidoreductase n=1 Tax=Winslowiella arboricola TaxID=2978220 RepID=A0A9J6PYV4_9GAMM|nr:NADH:flavin oxidoreductase [Winslowiella arboricola]MCU5774772.1 NADH:flavin oxidoreductase [Winslowiella arboricola]MCU5780076.1 NADH:flavin oxidoreductase [Winslowiella arboricola]